MSAAAGLRAPAGSWRVARHYLGMLGRETAPAGIGIAVAVSLWVTRNSYLFEGIAAVLPLLAFLPLFHWRGGEEDLGAALPLGGGRHELVRVACGAALAAATLAVPVGLLSAFGLLVLGKGLGGYPLWYPLPLLAAGLACYLLGSAVWLRTAHPGRVLVVVLLLASAAWDGLGLEAPTWTVVYAHPGELHRVAAGEWIAATLAWLGAGCAAVGVAAAAGRRIPRAQGSARPGARSGAPPAPRGGPGERPRRGAGLRRRPPPVLTALRGEAALLRHRMGWPAVIALAMAWAGARAELWLPAGAAQAPRFLHEPSSLTGLAVIAFLWPLLVWMDEDAPAREHADALPVGALARRLARVAAGGAALAVLCAVALAGPAAGAWMAGTLSSPAVLPARVWAGVPAGVMMMYLAGSLPLLLSTDRPVRRVLSWWVVTFVLVLPWLWSVSLGHTWFSPNAALSVFTDRPVPWAGAALVWVAVLTAAVAYAAARGVRSNREGRWAPGHAGRAG